MSTPPLLLAIEASKRLVPRNPLARLALLAGSLALVVALGWSVPGQGSTLRPFVAATAACAMAVLLLRSSTGQSTTPDARTIAVLSRAPLSQKNGLALVEVEGRRYLVAHGDGFVRVRLLPVSATSTKAARSPQE